MPISKVSRPDLHQVVGDHLLLMAPTPTDAEECRAGRNDARHEPARQKEGRQRHKAAEDKCGKGAERG